MGTQTSNQISSLIKSSLQRLPSAGTVSVMPDYFVDRFVRIQSVEDLIKMVNKKSAESGGGSIRGISQLEVKGGNAVNLAYALGKFGAIVHLITIADSIPARALVAAFAEMPNVKLDIIRGKAGYTIALEF